MNRLNQLLASVMFQRVLMASALALALWGALTPGGVDWLSWLMVVVMVATQVWVESRRRELARWQEHRIAVQKAHGVYNPERDAAVAAYLDAVGMKGAVQIADWLAHHSERHVDDAPPVVRDYLQLVDRYTP